MEFISASLEETQALAFRIGRDLQDNSILCFFGDLGAGKTTFIKSLVAAAAGYPEEDVNSPTFTYLNIYEGRKTVYHFDLYRIHDPDEFIIMGFHELFYAGGICCIEWAERIENYLPPDAIRIRMKYDGEYGRRIYIK